MNLCSCSFCGKNVYPGHGTNFVSNKLRLLCFCSSKCRKLSLLSKNSYGIKWVHGRKMRKIAGIEESRIFKEGNRSHPYNSTLVFYIFYSRQRNSNLEFKRHSHLKLLETLNNHMKAV